MDKRHIKNRILLLAVVCILIVFAAVFVGDTRAAYINGVSRQVIYQGEDCLPESNCLSEAGNIILMNNWYLSEDTEKIPQINISVFREGGMPVGKLFATTEQEDYIDIKVTRVKKDMEMAGTVCTAEQYIVTLTPNQETLAEAGEDVLVEAFIEWVADAKEYKERPLQAEVRLWLKQAPEQETTPSEPEEGTEETSPSDPESGENEETIPSEPESGENEETIPSEPESDESEETTPSEQTDAETGTIEAAWIDTVIAMLTGAEVTETEVTESEAAESEETAAEEAEESSESTAPELETTTESVITTENIVTTESVITTESTVTTESVTTSESTVTTESAIKPTEGALAGALYSAVSKNIPMLLEIEAPEGIDTVVITMQEASEEVPEGTDTDESTEQDTTESETLESIGFPAYTRYSLDGERYYILAEGGDMALTAGEAAANLLRIDFQYADMSWTAREEMTIHTLAYAQNKLIQEETLTVSLLTAETELFAMERISEGIIIDSETAVQYTVFDYHLDHGGITLEFYVEQVSGNGYVLPEEGEGPLLVSADYEGNTEDLSIILSSRDSTALAGAYRLVLKQMCKGEEIQRTEIPFFVRY